MSSELLGVRLSLILPVVADMMGATKQSVPKASEEQVHGVDLLGGGDWTGGGDEGAMGGVKDSEGFG